MSIATMIDGGIGPGGSPAYVITEGLGNYSVSSSRPHSMGSSLVRLMGCVALLFLFL
jgi:hypothetical protein